MKQRTWRWLVILHRWLAIATCLLFVVWFASGIVMAYVGFPELTSPERLAGLERIAWNKVRITPDEALQRLGITQFPRGLRLEMMAGEPVYRVQDAGISFSLSAVDGRDIGAVDEHSAQDIARRFAGVPAVRSLGSLHNDQWSVAGTFEGDRPLFRFAVDDPAGTQLYVSSQSGAVVLDTTERERTWNWFGAVLHWIYFTDLRANPPLWRQVVLWTSGIGIVVAISGLWLGVDRLRLRRRARGLTPFRGWMAWHHIAGVLGGVFVLTWIVSGWLSMGPPVPWQSEVDARAVARRMAAYRGNNLPVSGATLGALHALEAYDARLAQFSWVGGWPYVILSDGKRRITVVRAENGQMAQLSREDIVSAAGNLVPGAWMVSAEQLEHGDAYWYSHHLQRKLPVLRVTFDDPEHTWIYLDPDSGEQLARVRSAERIDRWTFNAVHSLDFRWLISKRPLWDIVLWCLTIAGLLISGTGVVIGWRRLRA